MSTMLGTNFADEPGFLAINRAASRPLHLHCGSFPALDVQPSLQGRTNAPDGPARPAVDERMEKRRSRAKTPPVTVQVAKGTPSVHSGGEESAFNERWQGVLTAHRRRANPENHQTQRLRAQFQRSCCPVIDLLGKNTQDKISHWLKAVKSI